MEIIIIGGFRRWQNYIIEPSRVEAMTQGLQPAVIMNEFGKQSVDGQLIDQRSFK